MTHQVVEAQIALGYRPKFAYWTVYGTAEETRNELARKPAGRAEAIFTGHLPLSQETALVLALRSAEPARGPSWPAGHRLLPLPIQCRTFPCSGFTPPTGPPTLQTRVVRRV
jgi:hypothetical protein